MKFKMIVSLEFPVGDIEAAERLRNHVAEANGITDRHASLADVLKEHLVAEMMSNAQFDGIPVTVTKALVAVDPS